MTCVFRGFRNTGATLERIFHRERYHRLLERYRIPDDESDRSSNVDVDGEFAGLLSVGADFTDRIHAERELLRTQRNLDRLSRANLLGELVTALAHELNQPLTAILSNTRAGRRLIKDCGVRSAFADVIILIVNRSGRRTGRLWPC
jgi:C4-dicarboxylate-specific signal transduction histidine kinase